MSHMMNDALRITRFSTRLTSKGGGGASKMLVIGLEKKSEESEPHDSIDRLENDF